MLKQGKYRAFRNIPVGWVLQAIHSTDKSERRFRVLLEVILFILALVIYAWFSESGVSPYGMAMIFAAIHTLMWLLTGNFWVYLLDSFNFVKNRGVESAVDFALKASKWMAAVDGADLVLIYGSMCRAQFHSRSDLDLRVVRRTDSWKGILALPVGFLLRAYSFFIAMPVDLQVVDSTKFLSKQMREDEEPFVVYIRDGIDFPKGGAAFAEVVKNPSFVLKAG